MTVRIGVVGSGFGQLLIRTLAGLPDVTLAGIADRNPASGADRLAQRYNTRAHASVDQLIALEQPDALVLAIPPHKRDEAIDLAMAHRLALFIEKPLHASPHEAERLSARLSDHDRPVMVGFSFRFHPAVQRLRALTDGELGRPVLAQGQYVFDWCPPADSWVWDSAAGGGFFNENSCHLFDTLCFLMGRPVALHAAGGALRGSPSPEYAAVTIRFADGGAASLAIGCVGAAGFTRYPGLTLFTSAGQAELRGDQHMWTGLDWALREQPAERRSLELDPERLAETRYSSALAHFAHCVATGETPAATLADGVAATRLAHAVYRSISGGQAVDIWEQGT